MLDVTLPPSSYMGPYAGGLVEIVLPYNRLNIACKMLGLNFDGTIYLNGCSFVSPTGCLIIIPATDANINSDDQARVEQHELGHCNGWRHLGDRPE